jgi:hypothetical protein
VAGVETAVTDKAAVTALDKIDRALNQVAQNTSDMKQNLQNEIANPGNVPGDLWHNFLAGLDPRNWLKDFLSSPLTGNSWLMDLLGLGTAHAAGIPSTPAGTGVAAPGGGSMSGTGIPYAPRGTLDPARYQVALGLNKAMPQIPWQVFYAWSQAENTNPTRGNNPLNIMYNPNDPNLAKYGETFAFTSTGKGATGIGAFPTAQAGYAATAALLANEYPGILAAAKSGDPTKILQAIEASPWAPGQYSTLLEQIFSQQFQRAAQPTVTVRVDVTDRTKGGITAQVQTSTSSAPQSQIGPATTTNPSRAPAGRSHIQDRGPGKTAGPQHRGGGR